MNRISHRFHISIIIQLIIFIALFCLCLVTVTMVKQGMNERALKEAKAKAKILLNRNLATHMYFSQQLKPEILEWTQPFRTDDYFSPTWMSSTYAIRQIDEQYREISNENYYYKECAINARSPKNEADMYEREFIQALNSDPNIHVKSEIRELGGELFFVVMRRGESMEVSCLMCHDTPDRAPTNLVTTYGPERSFHRTEGEVASAISIRIPLSNAYKEVNAFTWRLSLIMISGLFLLFLLQWLISRWLIYNPVITMRDKAQLIANDKNHIGETIPIPAGKELAELTDSFNNMSLSLKEQIQEQEDIIAKRTSEIATINQQLILEIANKEKFEEQQKQLIQDLQEALTKVKQLSGLLPICSCCKKIRDDQGYWKQIEVYIRDHSDAEFTHSLCEECAHKLYPEYGIPKKKDTEEQE
jgi:HAMP domain-containing protein